MALSDEAKRRLELALAHHGVGIEIAAAIDSTGVLSSTSDATHLGFFGTTAVVIGSAFTQTYATATHTHSNPTATALTAASGTADGTVADVGGAFNQTTLNNNFQDVATAVNAVIVDLANAKQVLNGLIDDLQRFGLIA